MAIEAITGLNLKRWLLEKVSEEKPSEVGEAASIDVQRATSNVIVAQSFSICQAPVAAESGKLFGVFNHPLTPALSPSP